MVRTERDGSVLTISFDRPAVRNAVTETVITDLIAEIETAAASEDVRVVVLTGSDGSFCSGGDIDAMLERDESPLDAFVRLEETLTTLIETLLRAPIPVIAKVNGDAIGAGTNIAVACDFVVASESARFGEVFVNVGLIPDSGGTVLLPRLVGFRTAKELSMTGRVFDAAEAVDMNLITEAVPDDELSDTVARLASTLSDRPTEILGLIKRGLYENVGRPIGDGLDREAHLQVLAYGSDSHDEGIRAFLEDRTPRFDR